MINNFIRKDLQSFEPYSAKVKSYKHKLDANESPFGLTENVRKKVTDWLLNENTENLNIYPDTDNTCLREAISVMYGITPENVTCGVGSDQLIDYITKVFLNHGEVVLTHSPTFSMYSLAALINHGKVIEVNSTENYEVCADVIIEAANREKPKIIFLCTPNNPTGNLIRQQDLIKIIENVKSVVVVDEAYAEFSDETMIPYIDRYSNIIILRTFSKSYGLAGARVGYAIACEEMINAINIVKAPYNMPTISQMLATEAIKDSNIYKQRIEYLKEQKDYMYETLQKYDFMKVYPSASNFIYIISEKPLGKILEEKGILVRGFAWGRVRLTVGTKEQNEDVLKVFDNI